MHCYLVERTFALGSQSLAAALREPAQQTIIQARGWCGVEWLRSYLTPDQGRSSCIVDAPSPEEVGQAARVSGMPVDRVSVERILERGLHGCPHSPRPRATELLRTPLNGADT